SRTDIISDQKSRCIYTVDRYLKNRIVSKEIGHIQTDIMHSHDQTLIISNKGTFTQILHIVSVPCHAPQVHTPVVKKYVGVLLPRTRQGPYCTGIGSNLDRSPTLCRTNKFILWPQSFNNKLVGSVDTPLTGVDTMLQTQDKIMQTGQVVSTLVQVVLTQCFKCKAKRSGSVDTSPGGVDTRDSSQNTFWPIRDSVSTLSQVVSTLEAFPEHLLGCFGISEVEEDYDFPQPFSTSPALQTCYSRPQLVAKPSPRV
ncbi:hypothetical protein Taro_017324, partial [Colocasia esculenta]|nr:hypothetical protein [Colocasia esculenta]